MILWKILLTTDKVTDFLAVTFHDVLEDNWFQSGILFAALQNTHQTYQLSNKTLTKNIGLNDGLENASFDFLD